MIYFQKKIRIKRQIDIEQNNLQTYKVKKTNSGTICKAVLEQTKVLKESLNIKRKFLFLSWMSFLAEVRSWDLRSSDKGKTILPSHFSHLLKSVSLNLNQIGLISFMFKLAVLIFLAQYTIKNSSYCLVKLFSPCLSHQTSWYDKIIIPYKFIRVSSGSRCSSGTRLFSHSDFLVSARIISTSFT